MGFRVERGRIQTALEAERGWLGAGVGVPLPASTFSTSTCQYFLCPIATPTLCSPLWIKGFHGE